MAERRMFSKSIISSARFLRMPPSSRLLYYDLGMAADDDGVAEAFTVMRTTGAVEDDLRVLVSKGFVTILNDDLVTYINDWQKNNLIKKDRYHPSIYAQLLVQMIGDNTEPNWNQIGTQMEPEVRLGKVSVVEDRIDEVNMAGKPQRSRFIPPSVDDVREYCNERNNGIDPQAVVDWYTSNGWKVGKNPMKDWKAAVRTWERKGESSKEESSKSESTNPFANIGINL